MKDLRAVCRIETKTKQPAIFYWDKQDGIVCYTRSEQHAFNVHPLYYRNNTRPARDDYERFLCESLTAHYAGICERYGDEHLVIRSRLSRKA